jgi:ABC-type transport system substrate-binding protein
MIDSSERQRISRRRLTRRRMLRAAGVAGTGLGAAALLGCSDDDEPAAATPAPTQATPAAGTTPATSDEGPRSGGILSLSTGSPQDNFNPVVNPSEGSDLTGLHVYDRLMTPRLDERVYVLEAAEHVEIPDNTTVVFTLREGLVYQDRPPVNGRPVVGDDVVQMQNYVLEEPGAINKTFQQFSMESVEAPDDRTVVFHLQRPNAYLFTGTQLGFPYNHCIVPSELTLGDLN